MPNVADISGWPIDHFTLLKLVWAPHEAWAIVDPERRPQDIFDSLRPQLSKWISKDQPNNIRRTTTSEDTEDTSRMNPYRETPTHMRMVESFQFGTDYWGFISSGGANLSRSQGKSIKISILGYHATLALELAEVWKLLPATHNPDIRVDLAVHVVDDELESLMDGNAELQRVIKVMYEGEHTSAQIPQLAKPSRLDESNSKATTSPSPSIEEDDEISSVSVDKKISSDSGGEKKAKASQRRFRLCEYFRVCASDSRLHYLNAKYLKRVILPKTKVANPQFTDFESWVMEFLQLFRADATWETKQTETTSRVAQLLADINSKKSQDEDGDGPKKKPQQMILSDSSQLAFDFEGIDGADVHVCTEPAALCLPMALAFPDKIIISYFGNPLAAYVPHDFLQFWFTQFAHKLPNLFPIANTRFLAKQIEYQTGRAVSSLRPLTLYVRAVWAPPTIGREWNWNYGMQWPERGAQRFYDDRESFELRTAQKERYAEWLDWQEREQQQESEGDEFPDLEIRSRENYVHRIGYLQTYNRQILVLREISVKIFVIAVSSY